MHGFMQPLETTDDVRPGLAHRLREMEKRYRWFMIIVIVPVAIVAFYLYAIAADQYTSEAHFLVRGPAGAAKSGGSIAQMLGAGSAPASTGDNGTVADYLTSHDVVKALRRKNDLVGVFRRPEADIFSRLPDADPPLEKLVKFYQGQVDVHIDSDSGITTMKVSTFRPVDSYNLAQALLKLGEQSVNVMNERSYQDAVAMSRKQLGESEAALTGIQQQMTNFRQVGRDADPAGTAQAQLVIVSQLRGALSGARAQLETTARTIGTKNPQYQALQQGVRSLEAQVAAQSGRLAGNGSAIAVGLGSYERLRMQQQFLATRYTAASAGFEAARQQAVQQQLYIVRVVEPNMPVTAEYPKRARILLTMFFALLVAYGLGWLIYAGFREHAA